MGKTLFRLSMLKICIAFVWQVLAGRWVKSVFYSLASFSRNMLCIRRQTQVFQNTQFFKIATTFSCTVAWIASLSVCLAVCLTGCCSSFSCWLMTAGCWLLAPAKSKNSNCALNCWSDPSSKILYKRAQSQRQSKYLHITNFICKYPVSVVSRRRRRCRRFG